MGASRREGVQKGEVVSAGGPGLPGLTPEGHSADERGRMIEATRWVNEFTWEQIKALASFMDCYVVKKDALILREGEKDAHMLLLVSGMVHIVKRDSSGVEKIIATRGPGETSGEMSLIDGEPRSASAVAATEVTLLALSQENFIRLNDEFPGLGVRLVLKIAKLMSQRLRQADGKLIDFLQS